MLTNGLYYRIALVSLLFVTLRVNGASVQDEAAAKLVEFEVASIKSVDPNVPHQVGVEVFPGGRVVISSFALKTLIATAFQLSYWQVSGGEAWMEKDEFHIEAKPSEKLRASIKDLRHTLFGIEDEHLREMLQALLIDRFQLEFHRATKTDTVYRLERNRKTLGLRPAAVRAAGADPAPDRLFGSIGYAGGIWVISATAMPQLAQFASNYVLHAPVLDRTELSGQFDYRQSMPDSEPNYRDNSDSFLRLIPEVGLKLVRSKGAVEIFVIDHAAKPLPN